MNIKNTLFEYIKKIRNDKIFVYASGASFYIMISFIPFITLFIIILQYLFSVNNYYFTHLFLPLLPNAVLDYAESILGEIISKKSINLISFQTISLLWTSSRGISGIRRGIGVIYKTPEKMFLYDSFYSILILFPLIIFIVLLIISATYITSKLNGEHTWILGIAFLTVFFIVIYYLFSSKKDNIIYHIPGAFCASISWIIFIKLFSLYINYFSNYSKVYGSLTAILLIALWIYFSTIIFFLGAELNVLLHTTKKELFRN